MNPFQWLVLLLYFPILYLQSFKVRHADFETRFRCLQKSCQNLLKVMGIKLEVVISSKIDISEPYYLVSNHQGTFDPILIMASSPFAHSFISKKENLKIPVVKTWGKLIEFITFDRSNFEQNVAMLRQATRTLKEGKSLLIFPEGTRSRGENLLPFKEKALSPAYFAKRGIVPLSLKNAYTLDKFGFKQYKITLTYHEPISYSVLSEMSYLECAKVLSEIIASV
ncbi:MAG TPA: 1-acyl-sn-glycerol-3-phosphate acyltransferase [Erysipelotrichaceae bacterium]|nr:1-acyl-sn-glycerol-3-phosphate acyltransferase [Erysipelotrichaceae bacterium]